MTDSIKMLFLFILKVPDDLATLLAFTGNNHIFTRWPGSAGPFVPVVGMMKAHFVSRFTLLIQEVTSIFGYFVMHAWSSSRWRWKSDEKAI